MLSILSSSSSTGPSAVPTAATASGWIALLQEEDVALRRLALEKLLDCVDVLWSEVAEALPDLEAMAEEGDGIGGAGSGDNLSQLAAAVASRVFFHLQEPTQALRLALMAGPQYFNPLTADYDDNNVTRMSPASSAYVQRLVAAALDAYVAAANQEEDEEQEQTTLGGADAATERTTTMNQEATLAAPHQQLPTHQLQVMVDRLLETSCKAGNHAHALGMALEARQVHKVQYVLEQSGYDLKLLQHAIHLATHVVSSKSFRNETLAILAQCLQQHYAINRETTTTETAPHLVLVYQLLHQPSMAAQVLTTLLTTTTSENATTDDDDSPQQVSLPSLLGLQMCFDLMDSGDQAFVTAVAHEMPKEWPTDEQVTKRLEQAQRVLVGGFSAELSLSFLHKQSQADRFILENLKRALEERSSGSSRNSVLHTAAVLTHAYLYAGTTNDSFLRDYLDWMKKASNWAKFSATASLGVIHAAHISEAMHLLQPYLPKLPENEAEASVSPTGGYAEGGSLYALGLIHGANVGSSVEKRSETTEYLRSHLRISHTNEVISHGAALGVGLTAMGTADVAIVQELKQLLDTDSAVAGEAAGMAIGMVLVGTGAGNTSNTLPDSLSAAAKEELNEVVIELKNYSRVTQHEKIIRGIAMGMALINFGQEENADTMIEEMRSDRDPVMRYGAQYALALAYCGTGSNKAIRILLHTAVSDVSDDVRMAAVLGLAFVLFKTPHRVPDLVKLLLESFNPNVRYASCMAVGIAMAGTGDAESIAMLEPMLDDMTDYVRQGALMGTAMIYMQQSDGTSSATTTNSPRGRALRSFREKLATIVTEKHQSMLTKMGAILSTGIIDAGGRNCTISLNSRNGFTKMSSAVGLVMWLQHWHWYPMMHMLSLALTPTLTIGLNKDLKYPKANAGFEIICNAKPSLFAYPKKLEEKKEEKKKRVETVTLSTTSKEKARLARKRAKGGKGGKEPASISGTTEGTGEKNEPTAAATEDDAMDVDTKEKEKAEGETEKKKKRQPEPPSFRLGNPARITKAQSEYCEFDLTQRYRPIRPNEKPVGVIVLTDSTPEQEEDVGAVVAPSLEPEGELAPPEAFDWIPPPPPLPKPVASGDVDEEEEDDNNKDKKDNDGTSSMEVDEKNQEGVDDNDVEKPKDDDNDDTPMQE